MPGCAAGRDWGRRDCCWCAALARHAASALRWGFRMLWRGRLATDKAPAVQGWRIVRY